MSFHRVHALTNTFSGAAGEARVAAEFVRCGFRAAKPYWTDDEVDLLVLERAQNVPVPLVIQVKAVQFLPNSKQKMPKRVFIQGLKKRYVTKSPAFAVAIYRVDTDQIFFVDGPENVTDLYEAQKAWNKKHIAFEDLNDDDDVRIAVHDDKGLDGDWTVSMTDASWLSGRVKRLAEEVVKSNNLAIATEALWAEPSARIDSGDDDDDS